LSAGDHSATITISDSNASNNPQNVNVALSLSEAQAPILSAPQTSTGNFTITVTYNWPALASNWDRFELEESTNQMQWTVIANSPYGQHPNPWNVQLSKGAGTYYYRARAYIGQVPTWTPYSSVISVVVTLPARSITIQNSMSGGTILTDVVQVKLSTTEQGAKTTNDLLTNDIPVCRNLPGNVIGLGSRKKFNITVGNDYYVYIGIGKWEYDLTGWICLPAAWWKRTYFTDTSWNNHWVWCIVRVNDHTGGDWVWTISGSYTGGNLRVTPRGSLPIYFNITNYNPIK